MAVLCIDHHDQAHSTKQLSINLGEKEIIEYKKSWELLVKQMDAKSITNAMNKQYSNWNYLTNSDCMRFLKSIKLKLMIMVTT